MLGTQLDDWPDYLLLEALDKGPDVEVDLFSFVFRRGKLTP